jgi:calcineurin-like phosphoesterase family protein
VSRSPLPAVTVALDPGVAAWSLRRLLRRAGSVVGMPPPDPVLAVTRSFRLEEGTGLAVVRAAVEGGLPDTPWLAYEVDGFGAGPGGTIGLRLRPSAPLAAAASAIDEALEAVAVPADLPDERYLVPVARGLDRRRHRAALRTLSPDSCPWYRRIFPSLRAAIPAPSPIPPPLRPHETVRVLILAGGRPVAGYDLSSGRWHSRAELGDRSLQATSLRMYRRARGLELTAPVPQPPGETWLLGDLHLGHPGIALYASRPFLGSDAGEMDRVLIENWRCTVGPGDHALLLGDLCAAPDPDTYGSAVAALTGQVTLIRGNHDPDLPGLARSAVLEADGHRFLAIHDPADAPEDFDGWMIHGHLHDSDLRRSPFFDPVARRVNVSVETAGYRPVPLSLVCDLIRSGTGSIVLRIPGPAPPPDRAS